MNNNTTFIILIIFLIANTLYILKLQQTLNDTLKCICTLAKGLEAQSNVVKDQVNHIKTHDKLIIQLFKHSSDIEKRLSNLENSLNYSDN